MTVDAPAVRLPAVRLAVIVTEVFQPAVLAAAMPVIGGVYATGAILPGVGWAALTMLFTAGVPMGAILLAMRLGLVTDHHISRREQRRGVLLVGIASVTVGGVVLWWLGAPPLLVRMIALMGLVLAGATLVNQWWKLSGHSAVITATVTTTVILFGPALLPLFALVPLVGWARVRLGAHTAAQVVAGAVLGAVLAAALGH
jgi:membrane-associated phospholipid phosphatase